MSQSRVLRIVEATSVLLFFLQALRVIFSVLFGIIYDQTFAGSPDAWLPVSVLLLIVALAAPVAAPLTLERSWLAVMAGLAAIGRVALSINDADVRFWGSLLVLAAGGLYLAGLLEARRPLVFPSLVGALALDQVLRVVGDTYDLSLRSGWLPVQIIWAALLMGVTVLLAGRTRAGAQRSGRMGIRAGLALGALLFIETSLLALPNALSRWSGIPYAIPAVGLLALTLIALIPHLRYGLNGLLAERGMARLAIAVLLPGALMLAYFSKGPISAVALFVAQALALAALACLADGRSVRQRPVGTVLALGMGLLMVLNFLNAFAFTYPYSLPAMRGLGWAVYLLAGLAVAAGVLAQFPQTLTWGEVAGRPGVIALLGLAALVIAGACVWPRAVDPLPGSGTLRLATYNIHYGYDRAWHFTLDSMAQAIEENDVDVAALQEVDTGRLTSYAVDDAYYLARRLRMNVAYLPAVEHLTGIAILYRGSALEVDERLLTSLQEQTGIIRVTLDVGGSPFHAHGIWMGLSNEDTERQIREALDFIGDLAPASFGGDFNAEPGTPVTQAVVAAGFVDPFEALGIDPPPFTDPAIEPNTRIDYVWLRGLEAVEAWVPDSIASDHRMVVVEIQLLP
jgi:endonuclease/exonuclease/phosphatase family metal-dependent hydrolase